MMASTASAAMPKPRPYRRYLTSALHSRFVHAVLLALLSGLNLAFWSGPDYFWSWFPLGPAGLKAALFSMTSLFVFILQLATLNVGHRTRTSPFAHIQKIVFGFATYQTILWYVISAWWFCEAYIWSVPGNKQLGWIVRGDRSTPDRLNERPIYLRFFFTVLALVQSGIHVYCSHSAMYISIAPPATPKSEDTRTHPIEPVLKQLQGRGLQLLQRAVLGSAIASMTAPFIYKALFRDVCWRIHLAMAKPFFNLPRSDANPPDTYFIGTILISAFFVGALLSATWELAAYSFLAYINQEPIKNGVPLSAASKDPNGTLLNGLTVKRDVVKTFAFWELAIIAQKHPDRRRAIFADFERPTGPMWTLMHKAALDVISSIDTRIVGPSSMPDQPAPQIQITTLPKIARDARQAQIFTSAPPPSSGMQVVEKLAGSSARSLGQSRDAWQPDIDRAKQKLIEYAPSPAKEAKSTISQWTEHASANAIGSFFRTRTADQITGIVFGSPIGNAAIVVDAIESLTKMLVASLNEDSYGMAVQTVPDTVKQFSKTIFLIESLVSKHSQALTMKDEIDLREVLIVVERLKAGLKELLSAFQVFLNDVGLAIKDLNEAKKASEDRKLLPEPQQSKKSEPARVEGESQRRQLGSGSERKQSEEPRDERSGKERESRRLQPSNRRQHGGDGNVFGARDLNSQNDRRREMVQVR